MISRKTKSILGVSKPSFLSVNNKERNCNRKQAVLKTEKQQAKIIDFIPRIKRVDLSQGCYGTLDVKFK